MTIDELKQLVENLKANNIPTSIATIENENPYTLLGKINIVIANLEEILKLIEDLNTNKLNASKQAVSDVGGLVTPTVAPTSDKLVGIDNTGAQEQIGIGNGLSIENNVLSASASKLYEHILTLSVANMESTSYLRIINTKQETYATLEELKQDLYNMYGDKLLDCSGIVKSFGNKVSILNGIRTEEATKLKGNIYQITYTLNNGNIETNVAVTGYNVISLINDYVREL